MSKKQKAMLTRILAGAALFVLAAILYYVIMHFGARKYEKLGG